MQNNYQQDPIEYQQDLARALCQEIDLANLPFNDWFNCITALKSLGFSMDEVRKMCVGSDKYDAKKFNSQWNAAHGNFDISAIVGKAKIYAPNFNYSEFKKQWYKNNPQYDTRKFNGVGKPARKNQPAAPMDAQPKKEKITDTPIFQQKYSEHTQADIEQSRGNLRDFLNTCKEKKFRGLTIETLEYFGVGYIENWINPKTRALITLNQYKDKNGEPKNPPTPSRRIIIPSGNHYNAVALPNDRNNISKNYWKMHAGEKITFGLKTLNAANTKIIFATEGEIDAMSIWQAVKNIVHTDFNEIGFIANLSLSATKWYNDLDNLFASRSEKPTVIWIGDGDHRDEDEKHRQELLKRGYPTFVKYFTDENKKCDANDVLQQEGDFGLFNKTQPFWNYAETNLDSVKNEISNIQSELQAAAEKERAEKEKIEYERKVNQLLYLPQTDLDNARRIELMFGDVIRYNTTTELWGFYENGVWKFETSSNSALYHFATEIADVIKANTPKLTTQNFTKNADGSIDVDADLVPPTDEEKKKVEIIENLQRSWRKTKHQRNAIEMVKGLRSMLIQQTDLDAHPNLINCKNGTVVDLQTGKYYPASPTFYLTQQAGANYISDWKENHDHKVEKFLREILPNDDFRNCLLMWLAYSLTGEVNEEKFLFIKGRGGNGKGTLTKILLKMFGDYGCGFPIGGILYRKNYDANAATTAINILENKRAGFGEEIPPNAKTDAAQIKILTGGDIVPARKNYGEYRNVNPSWKLTFSGNNDLQFPDANDYGIKRRLMLIPFTQDFTQNPNTNLKSELMEQSSIDYLFNKLVRLAPDWYKNGLIIPNAVKAVADDYLKSQDFIADFIDEYCERRPDGVISRKDFVERLREVYPRETPPNNQTLKEMLEKIDGVSYTRRNKGNFLKGIDWK